MKSATVSQLSAASKTLVRFAEEFRSNSKLPVLDVGCGFGRNAVALASRGLPVVCVDKQLGRLRTLVQLAPRYLAKQEQVGREVGRLYPLLVDLEPLQWPFRKNCFAGIICVHFLDVGFLNVFLSSLIAGGCLYIETFGGQGGNYVDLPSAGYLRALLAEDFDVQFYEERKVGPVGHDSVAIRLLAKKRSPMTRRQSG